MGECKKAESIRETCSRFPAYFNLDFTTWINWFFPNDTQIIKEWKGRKHWLYVQGRSNLNVSVRRRSWVQTIRVRSRCRTIRKELSVYLPILVLLVWNKRVLLTLLMDVVGTPRGIWSNPAPFLWSTFSLDNNCMDIEIQISNSKGNNITHTSYLRPPISVIRRFWDGSPTGALKNFRIHPKFRSKRILGNHVFRFGQKSRNV